MVSDDVELCGSVIVTCIVPGARPYCSIMQG